MSILQAIIAELPIPTVWFYDSKINDCSVPTIVGNLTGPRSIDYTDLYNKKSKSITGSGILLFHHHTYSDYTTNDDNRIAVEEFHNKVRNRCFDGQMGHMAICTLILGVRLKAIFTLLDLHDRGDEYIQGRRVITQRIFYDMNHDFLWKLKRVAELFLFMQNCQDLSLISVAEYKKIRNYI